jgi:hypothetical protein
MPLGAPGTDPVWELAWTSSDGSVVNRAKFSGSLADAISFARAVLQGRNLARSTPTGFRIYGRGSRSACVSEDL